MHKIAMKKNFILTGLISFVALTSCKQEQAEQAKPIMSYKVAEIANTSTTLMSEYPTTLEGIVDVEIRAKVDGYIEKIFVDEGQEVKKGQILFKLETETATQDAAAAKARVDAAQVEVNRLTPLVERNIISDVQLQTAKANLANAKSTYQSIVARINYATIKSPVNGIVGNIPYRLGSYISSQTAEPLTKVSDISTIYAYFSINEKEQLDMLMHSEGVSFQDKIKKLPSVNLILSNGEKFAQTGNIETVSGQANTQTGSFNVRASFKNTDKLLRSGNTGSVQIPTDLKNVIVVPQKVTLELQDKRIALVVDENNKVKAVPIKVREVPGGKFYVVDSGLTTKDKLIVEGVGILTEGTEIKPTLVNFNEVLNPVTNN